MIDELLAPLFSTRHGRQLGLGFLLVAGCLLLYTLLSSLYTWHADYIITQAPPSVNTNIHDVTEAESAAIAALPSLHVFGMQANEETDFLPITSLQLHLTGIIKDTDDKISKVIVSEAGQSGKIYAVGDALTSGIKINSISEDGIVLEHGGRLEKLPLARSRLQFQDKPKTLWQDNN